MTFLWKKWGRAIRPSGIADMNKGQANDPSTVGIARVLGPTLVLVAATERANFEIWQSADPAIVYLNGLFLLVGGLFVVTNHNQWRPSRNLSITLAGWLLCFGGAFRMAFPQTRQLGEGTVGNVVIGTVFILGVAICMLGAGKYNK
ncbi:hypothetical protein K3172_00400 [Qipengyuania sp. 6B39]|uniref:hypothetical protein n=1 Tax=Qipengyuania proteolytica TaxID=2867239 RepID=UPI001C8A5264|nr:hypothetical protein [Qipengyuania proteolytica]MBX7494310.1 hypothetical protein [Qipengyuania proteolytica]